MKRHRYFTLLLLIPLVSLVASSVLIAADWPQFLGPSRDGRTAAEGLAEEWPAEGPRVLWKVSVGMAFSGPVVVGDRVFVVHRKGNEEVVQCLEAATGKQVWRFASPTSYKDSFGFNNGPWATPTVHGSHVFVLGAGGVLTCLEKSSGNRTWTVDTRAKFSVKDRFFGDACSPLVEGDLVILNVGAEDGAGVVAFKVSDGSVAWKSSDHEASYSTPVVKSVGGKRKAFFFTREGLLVLDSTNGAVESEFPWRARIHASVNAATPLVDGHRVFISTSYGVGATLLELRDGKVETVWKSKDALTNHYATSVRHGAHLYGYHGRQEYGPDLRCIDFATGKPTWTEKRFGGGSVLVAGDYLLLLAESGKLTLARAIPQKFAPLASASILAPTVRAYPAFANGRLYARNGDTLVCVDLRNPGP